MIAAAVAVASTMFAQSTGAAVASPTGRGPVGSLAEVSVGLLLPDTTTDDHWIFTMVVSSPGAERCAVDRDSDALIDCVSTWVDDLATPAAEEDGGSESLADTAVHASRGRLWVTSAVLRDRYPFNRGGEIAWQPARRRLRHF